MTGDLAPARDVLGHLVTTVAELLTAYGDAEVVRTGVPRVLAEGGASRQRASYERSGGSMPAVVDDLVSRTNSG